MTKRAPEPSDAPYGPIVRYFRRWSIGDGVTTGGAFGCDAPSPRLRGWLEIAGFDLADLSRKIDASTSWAVATPTELKREAVKRGSKAATRRKMAALAPLFRALSELRNDNAGRKPGKQWYCKIAAEYLSGKFSDEDAGSGPDEDAEYCASVIVASGVFGDPLPSAHAIEKWFEGLPLETLFRADDDGWEMPGDLPPTPKKVPHDPSGGWMDDGDTGRAGY